MKNSKVKIIISGGGTGGHVFPAISIANALKAIDPEVDILFVGAQGRMEMEKVPDAGYPIVGLPISGFQRKLSLKNLVVIFKLGLSLIKARKVIREFNPNVVVGVGGYASGPVLRVAASLGIPTLIQEQNSYAGVTNKLLAEKAKKICVAYEHMSKFFPEEKIILTGNPVRQDLENIGGKRLEAIRYFHLDPDKKTILVLGGSLGARTINRSLLDRMGKLSTSGVQVVWQTGSKYYKKINEVISCKDIATIKVHDFISHMDLAYAAADIVISRAGACTISELCLVGKPAILVPSPNVAEDHQTKNAMALVDKDAARVVIDIEANERLVDVALFLLNNERLLNTLSANISKMAIRDSAKRIAEEVLKLAPRSE
jgi:UDP-N-acetylglucosamine--N-acetylmuramyl-(pentapeptide) pyrophosphoryl-undecaprenol N-acetylglucosamine transferase